jgi:hypothetical protein
MNRSIVLPEDAPVINQNFINDIAWNHTRLRSVAADFEAKLCQHRCKERRNLLAEECEDIYMYVGVIKQQNIMLCHIALHIYEGIAHEIINEL